MPYPYSFNLEKKVQGSQRSSRQLEAMLVGCFSEPDRVQRRDTSGLHRAHVTWRSRLFLPGDVLLRAFTTIELKAARCDDGDVVVKVRATTIIGLLGAVFGILCVGLLMATAGPIPQGPFPLLKLLTAVVLFQMPAVLWYVVLRILLHVKLHLALP